ncbi:fumarylacetoacetate hydrolase family protein [Cryobacterium frigoriphilum]|uniref:Fumarylacetoacetate hydrolase family protein n=1 Tax=Cryobacterium frigoriphilum TaxID=1259150 RepID=A0A4R8ZUV3_9MICO|nr:fumarylacetoacetate hydrolase family protein [Cryobacterium frigoriphilum]TFD46915.1 fumarylacetoacetate hydrolase family protein [Cryobacterium frigoriphilum]
MPSTAGPSVVAVPTRLARIRTAEGPRAVTWQGDQWCGIRDPFARVPELTGRTYGTQVTLLAPCEPRVIVGMAHNGPGDRGMPPQAFLKSARTAVGPQAAIMLDSRVGAVNVEGELAVVLGRTARCLRPDEVSDVILGYTIGNDVTAIDQVALDEKMTQVKNGDGFTPLGPWITTALDWRAVSIDVSVNGLVRAQGTTADLAYNVIEQLVYLSSIMTLGAGDVVLMGAPHTSAIVEPGDEVAISLGGLGTLHNPVAALAGDWTSQNENENTNENTIRTDREYA